MMHFDKLTCTSVGVDDAHAHLVYELPTSWTTKRAVLPLPEGVPISPEGYDVGKHLGLRCE